MTDEEKEAWRKDLGMVGIMMESTENSQRPYLGKVRLLQRRQLPRGPERIKSTPNKINLIPSLRPI